MQKDELDLAHVFEVGMSFFPVLQGAMVLGSGYALMARPTLMDLLTFLFSVYIFPLLTSRLLNIFFPVRRGIYPIGKRGVEGWVLQLKVQMFLATFPVFERVLHVVPGLYSAWLRLWGSKIGNGVMWTPHVEVLDRSLLNIEDGVLLGHRAVLSAHAVFLKNAEHFVICKTVSVGAGCLIGADSILGPGIRIGKLSQLNVSSRIYPGTIIPEGTVYDERTHS